MKNLGEKSCGSCKHYELSSEWRRGWCRNTLLFAPSQSQMVHSDEIDCRRGSRDFWEPKSTISLENAGEKHVKLPTFQNPLNLFTPAFAGPAIGSTSPAGGHMMFASSGSGGGGGYDDDEYGYDDEPGYEADPPQDDPEDRPQSNRTRRSSSSRTNASGGRTRSSSYQPEERYWTDYLRIALPVIGIILMLGLLWIWASQLLGDDDPVGTATPEDTIGLVSTQTPDPNAVNTEPTGASTPGANTTAGQIPIPGQTTPAAGTTGETFNPTTQTPAAGGDQEPDAPATEEAATGEIAIDSNVEISEEVNVRPSAGTTEDPIGTAAVGETAVVISGPEEADGFVWWELVFEDGRSGFVAEDFLTVVP